MDAVLMALSAIQILISNPALGGGGIKPEATSDLLAHLARLIQGGKATAEALEAFAQEVKAMADAGRQPVTNDFKRFSSRLAEALRVIAEAKDRRIKRDKPKGDQPDPNKPEGNETPNGEGETKPDEPVVV